MTLTRHGVWGRSFLNFSAREIILSLRAFLAEVAPAALGPDNFNRGLAGLGEADRNLHEM